MTDIQKENKSGGKVPNLRFPSFEEAWEVKKLGEVATNFMYGMNTAATVYDGENQYIRITDIDERTRLFTPNPLSSPDGELEDKYLLEKGDILFARTGASVGKSYLYSEKDGKIFFAGFLIRLNVKTENPYFIFSQTLTEKYQKWVLTMSMRSGQPGINAEEYKLLPIALPSFEEQSKIAFFLSKIEERIQTQSKIINDLKTLKTTLSKKIFSGELRFKDNNGNDFSKWEEMKLKNIVIIQMGQSPDSSSYNFENIGMPLIQGNADILNRKSNPRQYTSKPTKFCDVGDLLLTVRAPVGYVGKSKHYACIGRGICSVKNNDKSILEFIYQFLLYFEGKWKSIEQGSTFTAVNSSDINSINILLPSIPEQTKIANFLSAIDSKIDMENQLLQKLEEQKKYLLQNMFV